MNWFNKHRVAGVVVGFMLAAAAGACAAWIIHAGLGGNGGGSITTSSTVGAVTAHFDPSFLTPADAIQGPGQTGAVVVGFSNEAGQTETITNVTSGTITSTPSDCAAHLTVSDAELNSALDGHTVATTVASDGSGDIKHIGGAITADSSLPAGCSGGSYTVTLSGTTTP